MPITQHVLLSYTFDISHHLCDNGVNAVLRVEVLIDDGSKPSNVIDACEVRKSETLLSPLDTNIVHHLKVLAHPKTKETSSASLFFFKKAQEA
jgi:hypothetical protein